MTVVAMSHGERSRYDTSLRFERRERRVEVAAMLLGVCRHQVYRLLGRLRADGAEVPVSRKRGRSSNWDFGDAFRARVLGLVRARQPARPVVLIIESLARLTDFHFSYGLARHQKRLFPVAQIMLASGQILPKVCLPFESPSLDRAK